MREAFTLIELAIVLVIIGLLIGGILVAQSMISNSKVQSFIRQLGQFDSAIENFETKYRRMPGDNRSFGTTGVTENGLVQDAISGYALFDGEIARFWSDLSMSGLKTENGGNYAEGTGNIDVGTEVPKARMSSGNPGFIAYGYLQANYYLVSNFSGAAPQLGGFVPSDFLSVDRKIDNGMWAGGNVSAGTTFTGFRLRALASDDNCVADGVGLNITNKNEACSMLIRIGTSTGNFK